MGSSERKKTERLTVWGGLGQFMLVTVDMKFATADIIALQVSSFQTGLF